MASSFKGWGSSWGNSWGPIATDPNALVGSASFSLNAVAQATAALFASGSASISIVATGELTQASNVINVSINETLSASSTESTGSILSVSINETASATDTLTASKTVNVSVADVSTPSDNTNSTGLYAVSVSDTSSIVTFIAVSTTYNAATSDLTSASDSITVTVLPSGDLVVNDTTNVTDSIFASVTQLYQPSGGGGYDYVPLSIGTDKYKIKIRVSRNGKIWEYEADADRNFAKVLARILSTRKESVSVSLDNISMVESIEPTIKVTIK